MNTVIDLHIMIAQPADGLPLTAQQLNLSCNQQGWAEQGKAFVYPISDEERHDLRWYLEESWKWPFEGFAERAWQIEQNLAAIGRRLYDRLLQTLSPVGVLHFGQWLTQAAEPGWRGQINLVSDIPWVQSLPWELLHDGRGFLVLRTGTPIAIVRRFTTTPPADLLRPITLPLRVLLVTARPDDADFIDPRGIASELLDAITQETQAGRVALEVLRPPSLRALRERLSDRQRPVHVVHFDGHGVFVTHHGQIHTIGAAPVTSGQGMLAFEDGHGHQDLVSADTLANILQSSGVQLSVFNACQSAVSSEHDVFSSVAGRLIQGGLNAVVAMSASVLVVSAARYVAAFYTALAHEQPVPVAHEQARQALHDDQRRHLIGRIADSAGSFVRLQDWWLPHYYEQRQLTLTLVHAPGSAVDKTAAEPANPTLLGFPARSDYGFFGRGRELLTVERALLARKCVKISGLVGIGKTALAHEAAEWLTRTRMYLQACYVSLERGGDAGLLCATIAGLLAPERKQAAATSIEVADLVALTAGRRTLLVVDDIDSLLPGGRFPLQDADFTRFWNTLLALRDQGMGIIVLSRDPDLGDARLAQGPHTTALRLDGLGADAGLAFARSILTHHASIPSKPAHAELTVLLRKLEHHPQAIRMVLPTLSAKPQPHMRDGIRQLMAATIDADHSGDPQSLLAAIEWALQQLSAAQRQVLGYLSIFVGGPSEVIVAKVTQIERNDWSRLRTRLEQVALVQVERLPGVIQPGFLRFHPLLLPYLRSHDTPVSDELRARYLTAYVDLASYLYEQDVRNPQQARVIAQRELPDLLNSFDLLLEQGDLERASQLAHVITKFLSNLGQSGERERLTGNLATAIAKARSGESVEAAQRASEPAITKAEFLSHYGLAQERYNRGEFALAIEYSRRLLQQIEQYKPESRAEWAIATRRVLSLSLRDAGDLVEAKRELEVAIEGSRRLLDQSPRRPESKLTHLTLLSDLATVLTRAHDLHGAARILAEAEQLISSVDEVRGQPLLLEQEASLLMRQQRFDEAVSLYEAAYREYLRLNTPIQAARVRNQVGKIAWHRQYQLPAQQRDWNAAEQHYREAIATFEHYGAWREAGVVSRSLTAIAAEACRASEAQRWGLHAVDLFTSTDPGGRDHINALESLSYSLIFALRDGDIPRERLELAGRYAQEALALAQANLSQQGNWRIYRTMALVARLRGDTTSALIYLGQERSAFLESTDSKTSLGAARNNAAAVVAGALGNHQTREQIALALLDLPSIDDGLARLDAFEQIWAGERDEARLVRNLGGSAAQCVQEVLRLLRDAGH